MDQLEKALRKLSRKARSDVLTVMRKLESGDKTGVDIRRIKGTKKLYRVRMGDLRLFVVKRDDGYYALRLARRDKKTYKRL